MKTIAGRLAPLLLIGALSPVCAELPALVESAFARAAGSGGGWGYTMTSVEDATTTVERFDPNSANGGWTLVAINGKPPTRRQLKKYAATSEARDGRDHPGQIDFRSLVEVESIALVEESSTSARFRFDPAPDDSAGKDPAPDYLHGTLVIDKSGPFVESLELVNTEPFSPATGVKILKMRVRMEFELDQQGRFTMRALSKSVDGRLLGLKRLKQATTVTYSELAPSN